MFIALRDISFAKGRFTLMGSVVALITLLVVLLSGLTSGLAGENVSAVENLKGDLIAFGSEKISFSDSTVTAAQWTGLGGQALGITQTRLTRDDANQAVAVFGSDTLAPVRQRDGELIVSPDLGLAAGDTVTLGDRPYRITAIGPEDSYGHTPVVWTTLADWQRLAHAKPDTATVVVLSGDAPERTLGTHPVSKRESLAGIGSYTSENGSLMMMQGFLFAISALVIGAFFTVWTVQRQGDIAIMKALGASSGYLMRDALSQALIVLMVGGGIGGAAGLGIGALAERVMPFVVDVSTTFVPVLAMIALGMAGAVLAVRRITSVDPLIALGSAR
ncbi:MULTISPECIES: ABC transporter permease [Streptosporangium]|uniref:ABC transport system permease protein n=1 Tax=Streptosporangium brasiliense TaxID=47480 RepID=A0ABT9QVT7_9ACTN|nr:ABC transporter permease [Streptosporangium brasiliense]MDP9861017.1 putative ABC transport system permease protein [Streptosporangium brasiliense]